MLFSFLFGVFSLSNVIMVQGACTNPKLRKEWRQLSGQEQQNFLSAVKALKARSPGPDTQFSQWNFDQFAKIHVQYQNNNHGKPAFFTWHRVYIHQFEAALNTIDSSIVLPYWDWGMDAQTPASSPVFQQSAFGGDGDATTHCLNSGLAAGWISESGPDNTVVGQCLKRQFQFKTFWSSDAITALISKSTDYETLHLGVENGPHGTVHKQVGGEVGDFAQMWSPNDPLFYIHHAMVDKIWWKWQQSCDAYAQRYIGSITDLMPPFAQNANDSFSTSSDILCYTYSQSQGDQRLNLNCPSGLKTNIFNATNATTPELPPANNTVITVPDAFPDWFQASIASLVPSNGRGSIPNPNPRPPTSPPIRTTGKLQVEELVVPSENKTKVCQPFIPAKDANIMGDKEKYRKIEAILRASLCA